MGRQQVIDDLYERHFTDKQLDHLLGLAGLDLTNNTARQVLNGYLLGTPHPHAQSRPSSSVRNVPIKEVEELADKLMERITALRCHPHSHADFWLSDPFGPLHNDGFKQTIAQFERPLVLKAIQTIAQAARAAQTVDNGRPPEHRKQRTIDIAARFFQMFLPGQISGSPTGKFFPFAKAFYSIAQGRDPDKYEPQIDLQVRRAAAKLKQNPNKTPLGSC